MRKADGGTLSVGTGAKKIGGFDMGTDAKAPTPLAPVVAFNTGTGIVDCSADIGGAGGTCRDALIETISQPDTSGDFGFTLQALATGTYRGREKWAI